MWHYSKARLDTHGDNWRTAEPETLLKLDKLSVQDFLVQSSPHGNTLFAQPILDDQSCFKTPAPKRPYVRKTKPGNTSGTNNNTNTNKSLINKSQINRQMFNKGQYNRQTINKTSLTLPKRTIMKSQNIKKRVYKPRNKIAVIIFN